MDCDLTVLEVLRTVRSHSYIESPTLTGAQMKTALSAGMVVATPLSGTSADLRRHESAPYSLQSFADSREKAKAALREAREALDAARGHALNFVDVSEVPAPVPSGRDGAWSFEVTVTASVRARA